MSHRTRRAIATITALLAGAAGLAACGSTTDDASGKLTVGFVVDPSWAQIPVAQQEGYFKDHGLSVKVVNFSTGVEALQALAAGQVDVTTAADVPSAAALAQSSDLKVIADGSRWTGSRIVARRDAGIQSVADLAGKRIGTPGGTSAAYFASSVLTSAKVDAELVQVAPPAILTAATQGDVDAVAIFQPYQAQVVAALGDDAVVLEGGADTYQQHSLYLATEKAVSGKKKELKDFLAALDEAGADLASATPQSTKAVTAATKLDAVLVATVLGEFDFTLEVQPTLADELRALGEWGKANDKLPTDAELPDYGSLLVDTFLPAN